MPTKRYRIGQGTTVQIGPRPTTGNTTFTTIEGATAVELAAIETAQIEITNFGSNGMREYRPGLKEGGTVSVEMMVDAGDAQDALLYGLLNDQTDAQLRVTVPNVANTNLVITYGGYVTAYNPTVSFENVSTATLEFKVSSITRV